MIPTNHPLRKSIHAEVQHLGVLLNTVQGMGYLLGLDNDGRRLVFLDKETRAACYELKPNPNGYWTLGVLEGGRAL